MEDIKFSNVELESKYANLLKDVSFQKFEMLADNPNIFEILKAETYEIRHSNFLAWLLNPKGNHGLGDKFLRMFLIDLALDEKSKKLDVLTVQNLDFSNVEILREWKNIDIVLLFNDLVVAIENKINHFETKGQLEKYSVEIEKTFNLEHKVFVFLNPNGYDASHEDFISYSYETIANYLEEILILNKSILNRTRIYLEDYLENLKNTIMGVGEKNELVNKIYRQHKEFIDYIIQNKSSELQEVKVELEELIKNEGWIIGSTSKNYLRFLTPELDRVIPKKICTGWKEGEAFLFEIYFYDNKNEITTYCTVSPSNEKIRSFLLEILKPIRGTKKQSKYWSTYKNKTHKLKDDLKSVDSDYSEIASKILIAIKEMVNEVEPILLSYKEQILELKKQL